MNEFVNSEPASQRPSTTPRCPGHNLLFKRMTSKTERNRGRVFYQCPMAQSCTRIEWEDEWEKRKMQKGSPKSKRRPPALAFLSPAIRHPGGKESPIPISATRSDTDDEELLYIQDSISRVEAISVPPSPSTLSNHSTRTTHSTPVTAVRPPQTPLRALSIGSDVQPSPSPQYGTPPRERVLAMRPSIPRRREDITPPTIIPPWAISTASHAESNIGGNESSPNDVEMQLEIVESNDYEEISEPVVPSSPSSTSLKRKDSLPESETVVPSSPSLTSLKQKDSLPESEPVVPSCSSSTSLKRKVSTSPESPRKRVATDHLLESTDPKEWKYIAEGGANVVFAYEGSDVLFKGKVLRIKKVSSESPTPANVYWTETGLRQVLCGVQAERLLPLNEHISVKSSWVQQLDALSRPFRPPHRTKGKNADLDSGPHAWITLTENLHRGKGYFAVELKPKVGFSSGPVCRYCLKRSGNEPQPGFCPIDLYSTDYRPRYTALQYLVRDWHAGQAGNNLRVFEDGLSDNIDQSLTSGNRLSHMLGDILGDSRVLDVLLQLQQGYDRLSFKDNEIPDAEEEAEAGELATLLKAWPHVSDTRGKRIAYTISAIFKDCSIIIAWPKEDVKKYSIGLVDLDIKPMSKFARWKKQETDREHDDGTTIFCGAGGRRGKTIPVLPMIPLGSDTTAVLTRETKRLQSIEDEHKVFLEWLRAAPRMTGKDFTDTADQQHIL